MYNYDTIEELKEELLFEIVMDNKNSFDNWSNYVGYDWSGWVCGIGHNRDSDILTQSNFHSVLKALGGEIDGVVEVRRVGHWVCGWFEQIMVNSKNEEKLYEYLKINNSLADYPVFDDDDFSEREMEYKDETFEQFESDFIQTFEKWSGLEVDNLRESNKKRVVEFLRECFEYDCGYCGVEDGYIEVGGLERFLEYEYAYTDLIPAIEWIVKGKKQREVKA